MEHSLKHCWLGPIAAVFFLVCGQRSGRDVVGLVQSWSAVLQQFVLGSLFFLFFFLENISQAKAVPMQQFSHAHCLQGVIGAETQTCSVTLKVNAQTDGP